jgi:hypothetical protein
MKWKNYISIYKYLIIFIIIISLFSESCDLDEISRIKEVKVNTDTRVVLPLAYGTIELQTLISYVRADSLIIPIDKDGFFSFKPAITEVEFPDTFAFKGSMLDVLSHLELRIETLNSFPLGIHVELTFIDSVNTILAPPIECNLLEPAAIDQSGKVIEPSHHVEYVVLTNELISVYHNAYTIEALIRFYLPETDQEKIYINQKDFLSLNIGVVVQAKTNEY